MYRVDNRFILNGDRAALEAVRKLADAVKSGDIVTRAGRALEREALKTVRILTPRQRRRRTPPTSRRGGAALFKDWRAITQASVRGRLYQSLILNEAAKSKEGAVILMSLEGGAKPHEIDPVKGEFMWWISDGVRTKFLGRATLNNGDIVDRTKRAFLKVRAGELVRWAGTRATGVKHPGVRKPFGMVQRTAALMDPVAASIGNIVLDAVGQAWNGDGTVRIVGFNA